MRVRAALLIATLCVSACGGSAVTRARHPGPDRPVPESAPREAASLVVDLPAASGCETRFDLALYENRGVDLIEWDDQTDSCSGRSVTIRYLSRRLSRTELLAEVQKLAQRVIEKD